ncbi:Hypothetical protein CINCED_3A007959 [Cinara cedri]|uniref:Uncharacterized protein n=1 Tax=Cinara cedri TaxID=506608 RepID=A0A5E4MEK0_9HEMI|nr:Hypothetical protein CINCED_3A007959 [Cinara cedri]
MNIREDADEKRYGGCRARNVYAFLEITYSRVVVADVCEKHADTTVAAAAAQCPGLVSAFPVRWERHCGNATKLGICRVGESTFGKREIRTGKNLESAKIRNL